MHVSVFVGGYGTRLGAPVPKPLVPVGDRRWLDHVLDQLHTGGATRITLLVGPHRDAYEPLYGDLTAIVDDPGTGMPWNLIDGWWAYGDVFVPLRLWEPDRPTLVVTRNCPDEPPNLPGGWLDAGRGYGPPPWRQYQEIPDRTWQINTPDALEDARAHLLRHG